MKQLLRLAPVSEAFFLLVLSGCRLLKDRSVHTDVPLVFYALVGPGVALGVDSDCSGQLTDDQMLFTTQTDALLLTAPGVDASNNISPLLISQVLTLN